MWEPQPSRAQSPGGRGAGRGQGSWLPKSPAPSGSQKSPFICRAQSGGAASWTVKSEQDEKELPPLLLRIWSQLPGAARRRQALTRGAAAAQQGRGAFREHRARALPSSAGLTQAGRGEQGEMVRGPAAGWGVLAAGSVRGRWGTSREPPPGPVCLRAPEPGAGQAFSKHTSKCLSGRRRVA